MKIVLRADVDNVGKKGDIIDVADGFARNFLLPKGQAIKANNGHRRPGRRHAPLHATSRTPRTVRRPRPWPAHSCPWSSASRPAPAARASCSARSPATDVVDAVERADRRRTRPPQGPPRRADPHRRHPRGAGAAPHRRAVPHHRRGHRQRPRSPRRIPGRGAVRRCGQVAARDPSRRSRRHRVRVTPRA